MSLRRFGVREQNGKQGERGKRSEGRTVDGILCEPTCCDNKNYLPLGVMAYFTNQQSRSNYVDCRHVVIGLFGCACG